MVEIIKDASESNKDKDYIVSTLNDYAKPEMISLINPNEIDKISLLKIFGLEIADFRENIGMERDNIILNFVNRNLILRRSIKAFGSEQIVKVLYKTRNEEEIGKDILFNKLKNI